MIFKTIQWCSESAQIICLPGPGSWNDGWPKSKRLCTGILLDGIRLDDVRCSKPPKFTTDGSPIWITVPKNGKHDNWRSWTYHQTLYYYTILEPSICSANNHYWISQKVKHVVTFTAGPTSKCVSKNIPFQRSLKVYQHLPADGQRLLCSIQGKVVEDIGSYDRFRFQPLVVENECVGDVSVIALNGWTALDWSNLLEPWE